MYNILIDKSIVYTGFVLLNARFSDSLMLFVIISLPILGEGGKNASQLRSSLTSTDENGTR